MRIAIADRDEDAFEIPSAELPLASLRFQG